MENDPQDQKIRLDEEHHFWFETIRLSYYTPISTGVDCALCVSTPGGSSLWRSDSTVEGGWRHLAGLRRIA